jgi:hypothetical protein
MGGGLEEEGRGQEGRARARVGRHVGKLEGRGREGGREWEQMEAAGREEEDLGQGEEEEEEVVVVVDMSILIVSSFTPG